MYIDEYEYEAAEAEETDWLERDAYARKPCDVNCKICAIQDRASEMILREKGWSLSRSGEFCPSH